MASPPAMPPASETTTLIDSTPVSALCSTQHPMTYMTGVFTRLTQEHFARPENLLYNAEQEVGKQQLENYIWNADATLTQIKIQPVYSYNAEDIARTPAIYIKRNKWISQRIAIAEGGFVQVSRSDDGTVREVLGAKYSRQITGSHTFFCVAKTAQAAELLATEMTDFLMSFAPAIQKDLNLFRLEVTEIEGVAILEELTQSFVVPVVLAYVLFRTWRLNAIAPWLKSFSIDLK